MTEYINNIKNIMASKYPFDKKKEKLQSNIETIPPPSYPWNNNKVFVVSVCLGILFLVISLPSVYSSVGKLFNLIDDNTTFSKIFTYKLSIVNSILFTIISFILLKIINSI